MQGPQGQGLSHWRPVCSSLGDDAAPPDQAILERNLRALFATSPAAVRAILEASPRYDLSFTGTDEGLPSATIQELLQAPRQLASRRRPMEEAGRWAQGAPIEENAALIVPGFGLGYHLAALAERLGRSGVIICFEPDLGLLRGVLERIDHTPWLGQTNFVLIHREDEPAIISGAVAGFEGYLASGTKIIEHPISKGRIGAATEVFGRNFVDVIKAVRTNVITTMVQMQTSMHNMCMNLAHYGLGEGIQDLQNAAAGRPAVIVAAGPSLERNIAELSKPGVRDACVIIATQTTLRPLLARGIKPHFVTALDYHEVSKRFYEGLTASDVEGVTLVVEPQANAAILDAYPGRIRCLSEEVLDVVLGEKLFRPMGKLPKGATVAHLAYYLARYLGCDPVLLVGQDLGFTDGQYYAGGAQIHNIWASELNPFRSLEMMEWERVKRMGGALRKAKDSAGRDIYTDEQMATYLVQFERDFLADKERGLKTFDATEGGVAKAHTVPITLARGLEQFAKTPIGWKPGLVDDWQRRSRDAERQRQIIDRLREIRRDVLAMEKLTQQTQKTLEKLLEHQRDQNKAHQLIAQVESNRDRALAMREAFWLTQYMNQAGALRRFKADRAIDIAGSIDDLGRQRLQIERDLENMKALREASELVGTILDDALTAFAGGPKVYRPRFERAAKVDNAAAQTAAHTNARIAAVIIADPDWSGMGASRDLSTLIAGANPLVWTLRALAKTKKLRRVVLATDQPERIRQLIGKAPDGLEIDIRPTDLGQWRAQRRFRLGGRAWSRRNWRGGPGGLSVYDEAIDLAITSEMCKACELDAAVGVGADWALLDPALADALVDRFLENPEHHRITFAHAAPGLGAMLIAASTARETAQARSKIGLFATPAGMVGYIPVAPQFDPIARSNCVIPTPVVRDATLRCIPDSPALARAVADVLAEFGPGVAGERSIAALSRSARAFDSTERIVIELTTRRPQGARLAWEQGKPELDIAPAALERAIEQVRALSAYRPIVVSLAGRGDPLEYACWRSVVDQLREAGASGIHVRTQLAGPPEQVQQLLSAGIELVSVDLLSIAGETFRTLAGVDTWAQSRQNLDALVRDRGMVDGIPGLLVVPRITKCDLTLPEVELFYDYWIMHCGAAAIDALPAPIPEDHFRALPIPSAARDALAAMSMGFRADGQVTRVLDERMIQSIAAPLASAAVEARGALQPA